MTVVVEAQSRIRFEDGQLDDVASILHAAHPRASQYLSQAPILAVVVCRKMEGHVTYGEVDAFVARVSAEPRLRDLLADYQLVAPMRKLSARAIRPRHMRALQALAALDASTLSQAIPADSQSVWLDGIDQWVRRRLGSVAWIARILGEDLSRFEQIGALIDFLTRGNGVLNERWNWQRAMEAVERWHFAVLDERALRRRMESEKLARTFDDVICKAALPDSAVVEGLTFTPLRTIRRLREEGVEMRHCVASYASSVKKGDCAIVSVKRDGVGVATLELDRSGRVTQLKGHCNQTPTTPTRTACELYALLHWRAPEAESEASS